MINHLISEKSKLCDQIKKHCSFDRIMSSIEFVCSGSVFRRNICQVWKINFTQNYRVLVSSLFSYIVNLRYRIRGYLFEIQTKMLYEFVKLCQYCSRSRRYSCLFVIL